MRHPPKEHTEFKLYQLEVEFALMRSSWMAKTIVFCGILVVHWIGQFLAWSHAESSAPMRVTWKILAAPLVPTVGSLANQYFWAVASLNSVLWAAVLTYIVARYILRH